MLNILFIADVIGAPGRDVVQALLPELKRRHALDLVVCNGENAAGGFGLTRDSAGGLFAAGIDVLTGGNHIWDRKESLGYLREEPRLVRPANLPPGTPGEGWRIVRAADGTAVGIINLLGRVFMKEADDPFRTVEAALEAMRGKCRVVVVDIHAETTAEKIALGWYLDGRVSLVVGTHTHVQTADERVLPQGTAFICDAGMTGGFESVIGMDREAALRRFLTSMPERLTPASGDLRFNGVVVRVDPATGRAESIERLHIPCTPKTATTVRLLPGDEPAAAVRAAARVRVAELRGTGVVPTLALVSVGEDAASQLYLRRKVEACAEVGIEVKRVALTAGADTGTVVERVRALGASRDVHGILIQLPLPAPADAQAAIVGRPLASLLSGKGTDMTVTVGHSASGPGLRELARQADLLVAAIGRPEFVTADWIKPGATVVDVGIHSLPSPRNDRRKLVGDVEAASASKVAGALTPVPGGVGPMTVAMVVANTVLAAEGQLASTRV